MGKYKINQDAWQTATLALLRYMESKDEMTQCIEESMTSDPETRGRGSKQAHPDPTQAAAIRLTGNERYRRLRREVQAVDSAIEGLSETELKIIRCRFWMHGPGYRKPCPYKYLGGLGYEHRQMQKIIRKVIIKVAAALGEI